MGHNSKTLFDFFIKLICKLLRSHLRLVAFFHQDIIVHDTRWDLKGANIQSNLIDIV